MSKFKLYIRGLALTKLALALPCFCIINPALGKLESEIFKYPDPEEVKNIEITLRGKTKSGKRWIAFNIKQLSKLGINPLSEMQKLPKTLIAGDKLDLNKEENMKKYIDIWNKNCEEGYPYGGLFIYTDDDVKNRKLIGLVSLSISKEKTDELEFSIAMMSQYQPKNNSKQLLLYKTESDDNYRSSILEGIFKYGKEITEIGYMKEKFSISLSTKENDEKVNNQILNRFSFEVIRNGKMVKTPLLGFSSVCSLEDNWLQLHMEPNQYKRIAHVIADFRASGIEYSDTITREEFLKLVTNILPADGNKYSILLSEGLLLTIKNKNITYAGEPDARTSPDNIIAYYCKQFYVDCDMRLVPMMVRPISLVGNKI